MLVIGLHRQAPIYVQAVGADSISARNIRATTGASGTPPSTRNRTVHAGANTVRPCALFAVSSVGRELDPSEACCLYCNFALPQHSPKTARFTQTLQNLYASLLVKYPLTKL